MEFPNYCNYVCAMRFILLSFVIVLFLSAGSAHAADRKLLGTFNAWDAFTIGSGKSKECFMASVPKSSQPGNVTHGQVYATVAHKPERKVRDEVNIVVGYDFSANSDVRVTIGGTSIDMFTAGKEAWADSPAKDAQLVAAMKRGSEMTVKGKSGRGTNTTYLFSLMGFSAAYGAISQACPK